MSSARDRAVSGHRNDPLHKCITQTLVLPVRLYRKGSFGAPGIVSGRDTDLANAAQFAVDERAIDQSVAGHGGAHVVVDERVMYESAKAQNAGFVVKTIEMLAEQGCFGWPQPAHNEAVSTVSSAVSVMVFRPRDGCR
jgi:hypothetical protein